jgi:ATP-dependent Zn protease
VQEKLRIFSLSGSDFVEMFVMLVLQSSRFIQTSKRKSPAIIIDEIEYSWSSKRKK